MTKSMQYSARIFSGDTRLPEQVAAAWRSREGLAFDQTLDWYDLLYTHVLRPDHERRTIVVYGGDAAVLLAVVPLMLENRPTAPLGIKSLRSLSNYYSSVFDVIPLTSDFPAGVFDEIAARIAGMKRESRVVEMGPMVHAGDSFAELARSLERHGYMIAPYRRFANWHHLTRGQSFDEYFDSRDSRIRNTFKRKEKKLARTGYSIDILHQADDLDEALRDYEAVYDKSWKIDESHPQFIRALCKVSAHRGELRLGILRVGDTPIAAQIWIVREGVASIFKLSYDEAHKSLSAGTILTMALMRHVMDIDRVQKIDYLTGDDAYKSDYMNSSRELWALRAYRIGSLAGLLGVLDVGKVRIRRALKSIGFRQSDK